MFYLVGQHNGPFDVRPASNDFLSGDLVYPPCSSDMPIPFASMMREGVAHLLSLLQERFESSLIAVEQSVPEAPELLFEAI